MMHRTFHIGLFFALTLCAFLGPTLFGYVLYPTGEDLVSYYYPIFDFYKNALQSGQSFLWFPYIFSGFPVYVSQTGGFFDPVNIFIFSYLETDVGIHARLALDFLLVMVFSYKAARSLGLSRAASALVGPSYLMAFHWRFLSNPVIANTLFLLPLLVFILFKAINADRISWRHIIFGGVGLSWALLSGYTQLVAYSLLLIGIIFLSKVYLEKWQFKQFLKGAGAICLLVFLGIVLSLPQTLSSVRFLSLTSRAEQATYQQLTLKAVAPPDLLLLAVPDYFYVPYVTQGRKPLYVGALWCVLALGALVLTVVPFVRRRWITKEKRMFLPIAIAFLFAFIAALKWSPIFWLLNKLPILDLFRFPFRFMFLGAFLLSLLGAFGLDNAKELRESRAFRMVVYIFASAYGAFIVGVLSIQVLAVYGRDFVSGSIFFVFDTILRSHFGFNKTTAHYEDAINRGLDAYRELLSLSDPKIAVPFLALAFALLLVVLFVRGKIRTEQFKNGAITLSMLTVLFVGILQWHVFKPSDVWSYPNPLEELGLKDMDIYRTYTFLPDITMQKYIPPQYKLSLGEELSLGEFQRTISYPNGNALTGMRSIDGYDQFEPSRTLEAVGHLGGELGAGYTVRTNDERRDALLAHLPLLGMMGGKYIMSGIELVSPALKLLSTQSASDLKIPFYIYENAYALPRYFLAARAEEIGKRTIDTLSFGTTEVPRAYLECENCGSTDAKGGTLTLSEEKNGSFIFSAKVEEEQYLVLSETNLPGWSATIDRKPVDIMRANGLYMAVRVPSGDHIVHFEYRGMLEELPILRALGIVE